MAAPSYGHDLVTLDNAEVADSWIDANFGGGGGGAVAAGPDIAMQGTNCMDRQVNGDERGMAYDNGSSIAASSPPNHIYQWGFISTPGLVDSYSSTTPGVYCIAGVTTANSVQISVGGIETYGALGRVGVCYVYAYTDAGSTTHPVVVLNGTPPDVATGSQIFGFGCTTVATVRARNCGADAVRYGTGAFVTSGVLSDPVTFTAFGALNDEIDNRWGILTTVPGGFELQGGFTIGKSASGLDTGIDTFFQDSNTSITMPDLFHCASGFSHITIDGADTIANFTNITIQTVASILSSGILRNPGQFKVLDTGASVGLSGCTFANIGETVANFDFTAVNTVWRETGDIVQRSGTFESCTFARASGIMNWGSGVLLADDLNRVKNCTFTNDLAAPASGCAIRVRANDSGKPTYTVEGCTFVGYGADDTNEAAFHYLGTEPILLSVVNGEAPSVSPSDLVSVSNDVALTVQVNNEIGGGVVGARVIIIDTSDDSTVTQGETDGTGEFADTLNFGSEVTVEIRVRLIGFIPFVGGGIITGDGLGVTVRFLADDIVNC